MAGGNWTAQNKVRPGIYINFTSRGSAGLTPGSRGTLAACKALSWGPVGKLMTISAGEKLTPYTGYEITAPQSRFLREAFKGTDVTGGPTKILLYRPEAAGAAAASATLGEGSVTVTALYPGVRGNDISLTVAESVDEAGTFTVATYVDGVQVDGQTVKSPEELVSNTWVTFSRTGTLAAAAGVTLTGGTDGTPGDGAYAAFLEALEPYSFDVVVYDGTTTAVRDALIAFVKRISSQDGRYAQLAVTGAKNADSRFVINCVSGAVLDDGTVLTPQEAVWWVAGAEAGAQYHEALSYARYPGAVDVSPRLTGSQIEEAILSGDLVLAEEFGRVRIETDINTLTSFTPDIGKAFRKNRTMRVCNTLANDIYREFSLNFLGKVNNDETGRGLLQAAILRYLLEMYAHGALRQRPVGEDVEVLMGNASDSVVINLALWLADSVEKIYMTITVM